MTKRIAAITTVRNDDLYLPRWIDYYGAAFGHKNLFVFLDGHDQNLPQNADDVNILRLPHLPLKRVPAMRRRAKIMSHLGQALHHNFDIVMAMDVDEFLILDPLKGDNLAEYLSSIEGKSTVSGLGLDVGQHVGNEAPLDKSLPFLDQRKFAHVSSRYTKPATSFKPITWGSGMHRVKGKNFHIDPNLFHFHFGMVDYELSTGKTADQSRLKTGWKGHLERREKLFKIIEGSAPHLGDVYFEEARKLQQKKRQLTAWNKPRMIKGDPVIVIPDRFKGIV